MNAVTEPAAEASAELITGRDLKTLFAEWGVMPTKGTDSTVKEPSPEGYDVLAAVIAGLQREHEPAYRAMWGQTATAYRDLFSALQTLRRVLPAMGRDLKTAIEVHAGICTTLDDPGAVSCAGQGREPQYAKQAERLLLDILRDDLTALVGLAHVCEIVVK